MKVIPVCPEVAIGLGVPRDPIRLVSNGESVRLVQPSSGRKLTRAIKNFSRQFMESLNDVDGFILKSRSPSCGLSSVKLFETAAGTKVVGRTFGPFAGEIMRNSIGLPVADERILEVERHRDNFLTHLFAMAAFRAVVRRGTINSLVRFHCERSLLLASYSQTQFRILDRIVCDSAKTDIAATLILYRTHLILALKRPMRPKAIIATLRQRQKKHKNLSTALQILYDPFPAELRKITTP